MGSLSSHEQRMNQQTNSSKWEHALQSSANLIIEVEIKVIEALDMVEEGVEIIFPFDRDETVERICTRGRGKTSSVRDKTQIQCHRCNRFRHYASECRTRLQGEQANAVEAEENMVLACK